MSMDIHWYLWIPEVIHKYMRICMNFYWYPCISIDVCGDPWIFHDIPLSFCSILLGTRCTTFRIWCRLGMVWLGWFRCRSGLGSAWDQFSVLLDQDSIALVLFWCRFGSVWGVTSHPVLEMWILFAMIAYFLSEHPGITHRFGSNWGLQAHVDRISMNHCFWELQQMKQIPISYVMWRCSKKHGALDSNGHHMISVSCNQPIKNTADWLGQVFLRFLRQSDEVLSQDNCVLGFMFRMGRMWAHSALSRKPVCKPIQPQLATVKLNILHCNAYGNDAKQKNNLKNNTFVHSGVRW